MKLGFPVLAVVLVVATLGLTVLNGCGESHPVRSRSLQYNQAVLSGDVDSMLEVVDPELAQQWGEFFLRRRLEMEIVMHAPKLASIQEQTEVDITAVQLSSDGQTAMVTANFYRGATADQSRQPVHTAQQTWVRREGGWFLKL